jgi:hypothetical protein
MVRRRIELRKNFPGGKIPEPYCRGSIYLMATHSPALEATLSQVKILRRIMMEVGPVWSPVQDRD